MKTFQSIRKLLWVAVLGIYPSLTLAQNLVQNPGFESYILCPNNQSQIHWANPWMRANGSPDLYNTCAGSIYAALPNNYCGSEMPRSGNGAAGQLMYGTFFPTYSPNYREYMFGFLSSPLLAGNTYYISFWVSLADSSSHATSHIGLKFTNTYTFPTPMSASADVFTTNVINQMNGWTQISGSFTPSVNYDYFMIGNFFPDSVVTVQTMGPVIVGYQGYYFIDDVCVSLNPADCGVVPLAVSFSRLSGEYREDHSVELAWQIDDLPPEANFVIERSTDEGPFVLLDNLASSSILRSGEEFQFIDSQLPLGTSFTYRIQYLAPSGQQITSTAVEVRPSETTDPFIEIGPNPISQNQDLKIFVRTPESSELQLELRDLTGKHIAGFRQTVEKGGHPFTLPHSFSEPGLMLLNVKLNQYHRSFLLRITP